MSGSTEERTFTGGGIVVRHHVETAEFPVPAVVLDVESEREAAASVAVTVVLPESIPTEAVGFHPEYGHEHWSVDGRDLTFDRAFDPGESFTTVYAVREVDDPSNLLVDDLSISVDGEAADVTPAGVDDGPGDEDAAGDEEAADGDRQSEDEIDVAGAVDEATTSEAAPDDAGDSDEEAAESAGADAPAAVAAPTEEQATADGGADEGEGHGAADVHEGSVQRIDELVDESDSQVVRDFIGGETDSLPGLEDREPATAGTPADSAAGEPEVDAGTSPDPEELGDDAPPEAESVGGTAASDAADEEAGQSDVGESDAGEEDAEPEPSAASDEPPRSEPAGVSSGGITRALVSELQSGYVTNADRELLRELLATEAETGEAAAPGNRTDEVRIDHLQRRVSDLEAYTDALETFLDENGTGRELLEELRGEMATLEEELDGFRRELTEVDDDVAAVTDELATVHDEVATVREDVSSVREEVGNVSDEMDAVREEIATVRDEMDGYDEEFEAVRTELREEVREELRADVEEAVSGLRRQLESDVQDVREDISEFEEFRERVATVFGGEGAFEDG
jgi:predicted  nucleic acid-binding Zn-ribbon protein